MTANHIADVAILIVGFRNPADIVNCLTGLSKAAIVPGFDVFICENGGQTAYERLARDLVDCGVCVAPNDESGPFDIGAGRFTDIEQLQFTAKPSRVWIGCAHGNLGYAGGINAWLEFLKPLQTWKGVWVLNPDTKPEPGSLAALVKHAETAKKGMVGSTIIDIERPNEVRCRGGLHWNRLTTRVISIGLGEPTNAFVDVAAIEAAMDSPSGASMYVTRSCLEQIGPMIESYFLFFEDLDWGLRAKCCGLGYASESIVWHQRGTTTGTARKDAKIPRFTAYLEYRNGIHFVRKHFPTALPIRVIVSFLFAVRFLINGSPRNFVAALDGLLAGLRGELYRPTKFRELDEEPGAWPEAERHQPRARV